MRAWGGERISPLRDPFLSMENRAANCIRTAEAMQLIEIANAQANLEPLVDELGEDATFLISVDCKP